MKSTLYDIPNIYPYISVTPNLSFWRFGSFWSLGSFWGFGSFWGLDSTTTRANGCSRSTLHGPSQAGGSALSSQALEPPLHQELH